MNPRPLYVFALKEENPGVFSGEEVLYTGLGKVQSAINLSLHLQQSEVLCVINLGTAGSSIFPGGAVVHCRRFIQRDMDCTALGFDRWQVPYSSLPVILEYGVEIPGLPEAICGTGDSFETGHRSDSYSIVDMEAYSLALVCKSRGIPFICVKYISDGADAEAAGDWNNALRVAASALFESVNRQVLPLVKSLSEKE